MRKVIALGAVILLAGGVNLAIAQERLPQHSGFGTGVGESAGTGSRSQIWDKSALLERLDQPETIIGRIFAIDLAQDRLMLESGGVGGAAGDVQGGRAGHGASTIQTLYMSDASNRTAIRALNVGDDVTIQAREEITAAHPFGTGKKFVIEVNVIRTDNTMVGMGGFGQHVNPATERGIVTQNFSSHGGVVGALLPGDISTGITSTVGAITGTAPCWQCAPQPGWGDNNTHATEYGDPDNPTLTKK